jgi:serine/threonine-protein kinase
MITERFASIADALSPRYRLERLLQSGVAAYVFLAEDRTSGRRVAVKVLRDEMTATVSAERFMAEIRVAAGLRHPNIVPVCGSGDANGLPYYVMPFIDGETLRARLSRLGRIPLLETLRITEDVACALQFAHRHHVVHRDIKPENVMLDGDRALVLDFGIALALDALEMPRRTLPGLTLGTVNYMSPEQLDGEMAVDGRSDVYGLACVVYEMLCGRPPFTGTAPAVIRRHLTEKPRPLSSVCSGASPQIGAVLARALSKQPDVRYPTAGDFLTALRGAAPRMRVIGRRIAVLPFAHVCGEPTIDTFSDGIGEEVAAALREFDGVIVAASGWVAPGDTDLHLSDLARGVGADTLLLGDVRESAADGRLSISATLFDARNGRRLWSATATGRADRSGGPTAPARELARAVAGALGIVRPANRIERSGSAVTPLGHPNAVRSSPNGQLGVR